MAKMIFVNLPVRDLEASTAFYKALGGIVNPQFSGDKSTSLVLSDAIHIMLLTHERYRDFTERTIGDARRESQALLAITTDARAEVDSIIASAKAAGGRPDPNPKQDHGFMYGRSVEDLDGYVWELVWMNPSAQQ